MLEAKGYTALTGSQCAYINKDTRTIIVAHVDDFLVGFRGPDFIADLQGEYECSGQVLGYSSRCVQVLICLGRTITLTDAGLEWEEDRRHADSFLQKLSELHGEA